MATGASVESRLKTGLDHGLHTHYGSATARMASHMKTVTIGMYHIHPLLVTAGVQGNCVIGREVCEKVYGRVFDPSSTKGSWKQVTNDWKRRKGCLQRHGPYTTKHRL